MTTETSAQQIVNEHRFSNTRERIIIQSIHWGIVLCVIVAVVVLNLLGHLSDSSATALLGTSLGHVGTSAAQKLSSRSNSGGN